jgi:hypothetical protein
MLELKTSSKIIITLLCMICANAFCISKDFGKTIYKKYIQSDSTEINNGAILILYTDSTFINYGILRDSKNQEAYIWYTVGKWKAKDQVIMCNSVPSLFHQHEVITEIKASYKTRIDHRLVQNYYEFVNEIYSYFPFTLNDNKAIDKIKHIEYIMEPNHQ